jgi:hypothetical protein
MESPQKPVSKLEVQDLQRFPVWEYLLSEGEGQDETVVVPVGALPVGDLTNRLVGTEVRLNNGRYCWALLENVDLRSARATRHFLSVSLAREGQWFSLARYHDVDYEQRGPQELAGFLDLSRGDVFPISYDISAFSEGDPDVVQGQIPDHPEEKLSEDELIELALDSRDADPNGK